MPPTSAGRRLTLMPSVLARMAAGTPAVMRRGAGHARFSRISRSETTAGFSVRQPTSDRALHALDHCYSKLDLGREAVDLAVGRRLPRFWGDSAGGGNPRAECGCGAADFGDEVRDLGVGER